MVQSTDSYIEKLDKLDLKDGLIHCFRCGVCCSRYPVRLSLVEARRISDEMGIPWAVFTAKCLERYRSEDSSFLLRQGREGCVFLRHINGHCADCSIQSFKPVSCIDWTPSMFRHECRSGLSMRWGLMASPDGNIVGSENRIRDFNQFMETPVTD